jgi:hypothetical protein
VGPVLIRVPERRVMAKEKSRSKRWQEAIDKAKEMFELIRNAGDELASACSELHEIQQEYQDWLDNLPENLENSALGEKLQAVCDIDIESLADDPLSDWPNLESTLEEAESTELPMGFGRD